MSLKDLIMEDVADFTADTDVGPGYDITMTVPGGASYAMKGRHAKHHLAISADSTPVNSKHSYVSISEAQFIAAGYPLRNSNGEVAIGGHLVDVADSTGTVKNYSVQSAYPDEAIGLITIILSDYAG